MGTRMLFFGGEEHMHSRGVPAWGGMHSETAGAEGGSSWYHSSSSPGSSGGGGGGGNTWSKRLASSSNEDSWEVRAFAEDASTSGQWPPRSYSCSFCQREFRTAQALGGHMNVHRRERAQANQLAQLRNSSSSSSVPVETNAAAAAAPWQIQQASSADHYRAYSPVRNHQTSPYESNWSRYDPAPRHHHHDSGLDLELRLGQRYD